MVEAVSGGLALLSIHPRFASAILDGTKSVEFRKRSFSRSVDYLLLYATAPVKRVVGCFGVAGIERAIPAVIWERHGARGGITREEFIRYYGDSTTAIAIAVRYAVPFTEPLPLACVLGSGKSAPQSFVYLQSIISTNVAEAGGKPDNVGVVAAALEQAFAGRRIRRSTGRAIKSRSG
jgi:predicted transcriptional regulator